MDDLNQTMRSIAQGDAKAMNALALAQGPRLFHTAYRLMNDHGLAEDALQETFIRLWQKAPLWEESRGSALSWIYKMLTNICLDMKRKNKHTFVADDAFIEAVSEPYHTDGMVKADFMSLKKIANTLPEHQKILLYLTYVEGFANKETAEIMNISVKNVEVRLSRLREQLRRDLHE